MAQNAHYHVLGDRGKTLLAENMEVSFSWNPSNNIVLNDFQLSPVLSFRADPVGSGTVAFSVIMRNQNGLETDVANFSFSGNTIRTIFEVLDRTKITEDGMNFLFKKTDGNTSLEISDVIVWFHRNI